MHEQGVQVESLHGYQRCRRLADGYLLLLLLVHFKELGALIAFLLPTLLGRPHRSFYLPRVP